MRQVQDKGSMLCAHHRSSPGRKVGSGVAAVFNKINRRVLSFCFLRVKARTILISQTYGLLWTSWPN